MRYVSPLVGHHGRVVRSVVTLLSLTLYYYNSDVSNRITVVEGFAPPASSYRFYSTNSIGKGTPQKVGADFSHQQRLKTPLRTPTSAGASASTALKQGGDPYLQLSKRGIELANLYYDSTSTAFDAWEWTACLGAPAALVAGAVLVTLSESRSSLTPRKNDRNWVRLIKQMTRFLLLSSFVLEVVSIFVSTITGTVLLSHGEIAAAKAVGYTSPLGLLFHHHEFEYLTINMGFLQGLIHWLAAVGLEMMVPKKGDTVSSKRMNRFMASALGTLICWILAFFNNHETFYSDYWSMLRRYTVLFADDYITKFRPMGLLYIPATMFSIFLGWKAFTTKPEEDSDDDDEDETAFATSNTLEPII